MRSRRGGRDEAERSPPRKRYVGMARIRNPMSAEILVALTQEKSEANNDFDENSTLSRTPDAQMESRRSRSSPGAYENEAP